MNPETNPHSAWLDDFFASYHAHRPVNATFIGVHDFDHLLPDFSEQGMGDVLADTTSLLRRSETAPDDLGRFEGIDRRLARGFLEIQEWELGSEHFTRGNPSLYTGEAVFGVMSPLLSDFAPLPDRIGSVASRMSAVPALLAQARVNVRAAPREWTERAIRECDGALAFLTDGVDALVAEQRVTEPRLESAAAAAAKAFADHRAHLQSDLLSRTHDRVACGPAAFDRYLKHGHFFSKNAAEIVEYAEVQLVDAEAYGARHSSDFGASSPSEALAGLRDLHPAAADYYARYGQMWDDVRRVSDDDRLLTWPDFPIRYVPRPTWARGAAPHLYFLFYRSPAAFDRPEVHQYLVAPLPEDGVEPFLAANNDSVIKLNHVIHHGGLGHHVQNWHAFRAQSRVGRIAAVDCASRIAMYCGATMAEGWACYATDLAAEAGMLTPLEQYAEVYGRVRMAARAIVDVRLHHGEMTLDQAAAFYQERAGMSAAAARGEAVKNSMFPGAALIYLMGTDAIHELRAEMTRRLGKDFDLCAFHDAFLSYGSIPVSLAAQDMLTGADDVE